MAQQVKNVSANAVGTGSIPGLGRSPGVGNGNPFQYSGLDYSMDWIVLGVAESDTTVKLLLSSCFHFNHKYKF